MLRLSMGGFVSDPAVGKNPDFKHFACRTIREKSSSMSNRPSCYLSTKNDVLSFFLENLTHFSVCMWYEIKKTETGLH